jgi:hypothetical protein
MPQTLLEKLMEKLSNKGILTRITCEPGKRNGQPLLTITDEDMPSDFLLTWAEFDGLLAQMNNTLGMHPNDPDPNRNTYELWLVDDLGNSLLYQSELYSVNEARVIWTRLSLGPHIHHFEIRSSGNLLYVGNRTTDKRDKRWA